MRPLVIGLGLPRTGTSSVRKAMAMLGYRVIAPCFESDVAADVYEQRLAGLAVRVENALDARERVFLSEPAWAFGPAALVDLFGNMLQQRLQLARLADSVSVAQGAGHRQLAVLYTCREYSAWASSVRGYVQRRAFYDATMAPPRSGLCDVNIALYSSLHRGSIIPDLLAVHARDAIRRASCASLPCPVWELNVERPATPRWPTLLSAAGMRPPACFEPGPFPHENRGEQ